MWTEAICKLSTEYSCPQPSSWCHRSPRGPRWAPKNYLSSSHILKPHLTPKLTKPPSLHATAPKVTESSASHDCHRELHGQACCSIGVPPPCSYPLKTPAQISICRTHHHLLLLQHCQSQQLHLLSSESPRPSQSKSLWCGRRRAWGSCAFSKPSGTHRPVLQGDAWELLWCHTSGGGGDWKEDKLLGEWCLFVVYCWYGWGNAGSLVGNLD